MAIKDFDIDLDGLEEFNRKLSSLGTKFAVSGMRGALRKGGVPIRVRAVENFRQYDDPKTPERIYRNIVVRNATKGYERKTGGPTAKVGILGGARNMTKYGEFKAKGKGNPGGDTFYWRFLELGTSQIPAKSPMRKAMATEANNAGKAVADAAIEALNKQVAKLNVR